MKIFFFIVAGMFFLPAITVAEENRPPQMNVSGQAELQVPADRLRMSIGVVTQAATAEKALQENNQRMREVAAALREAGLKKEEMETGQFRIEPQWSYSAAAAGGGMATEDQRLHRDQFA